MISWNNGGATTGSVSGSPQARSSLFNASLKLMFHLFNNFKFNLSLKLSIAGSHGERRRVSADVKNALENDNTWKFDILQLEKITDNHSLSQLGLKVSAYLFNCLRLRLSLYDIFLSGEYFICFELSILFCIVYVSYVFFTGYNPLERPVENSSLPLVVKIKLFLQQILDVDEKNQLVSINAWLSYTWKDYKLRWDPDHYGGIQDVRFPGGSDHIWKPDILLYNSTGEVTWIPPGVLKFVCKLDVTW
uniref:Neur_chan_LBD domain-containing protein n=1 Tax=Heterorhabditis bacteriophora TaxID=37862 RepID=A0A1I7XPJ2_HETBA